MGDGFQKRCLDSNDFEKARDINVFNSHRTDSHALHSHIMINSTTSGPRVRERRGEERRSAQKCAYHAVVRRFASPAPRSTPSSSSTPTVTSYVASPPSP